MAQDIIDVDEKTKAVLRKKGYVVLKKISAGNFGEVFKAKSEKRDELNAVKVMNLEKVAKDGLNEKYLDREIKALIAVRHPNVLNVHDIFKSKGKLYIFMEFAPNGTLTDKMEKARGGCLSEQQTKRWFKQCVDALVCMHAKHRMAHRDIKTDNVLLDKDDNVKLSDYGFARGFSLKEDDLSTTYCGTPPYFAPEILAKKPYNPFLYDVWSMGVMLFVMLNGKIPFVVDKKHREACLVRMKAKEYQTNPKVWDGLSDEVKDLINIIFTFKPEQRPNIIGVRKHSWFN